MKQKRSRWTKKRVKQLGKRFGLKLVSRTYKNQGTPLKWKCLKCNEIIEASISTINLWPNKYCRDCNGTANKGKKITTSDVKKLVKEKGYFLKKNFKYETKDTRFLIKCNEDHIWETTWMYLQQGHGCSKCFHKQRAEKSKLTEKEVKGILKQANLTLLSEYKGNNILLKTECKDCGYISEIELKSIQARIKNKSGCPKCIGHIIELKDIKKFAKKLGLKLISKEYVDQKSSLKFRCLKCKENIKVSWASLQQWSGEYCTKCRGTAKYTNEITTEQVKEKVKSLGGVTKKSFEYENNQMKFEVKCSEGHIFKTNWALLSGDHWCPECGYKQTGKANSHNAEWLHELAEEKGFVWMQHRGEKYTGVKTKYTFRCKEGHEWETTPESIRNGYGCHECASHRTERKVRGLMEYIFSVPFKKAYPKWLKGMELDGYNKELKLAFEYHGYQHYEVAHFDGFSKKGLKERQQRDKDKRRLCKKQGIQLIEIPYFIENIVKFIFKNIDRENMRKPSRSRIQKIYEDYEYKRDSEPKSLTIEIVSKIRKALLKGKTDKQIAKHFDISKQRIEGIRTNRICYDPDWTPIKHHHAPKTLSEIERKQIIRDIKNSKDTSYIANKYKLAKSTVYNLRSKEGLTNRDEIKTIKEKFRQGMTIDEAIEMFDKPKSTLYRLRKAA